jgi:modulator of FtsH protease
MIPTVLGAWIGVTTGIARTLSPGIGLVVFLVGAFGFMFAIEKTKNSAAGVPMLLAFTFFMGLMLSRLVGIVLGPGQRRRPDHDGLRRHRRDLPRHGVAVVGHQARPVVDGQVLFIGAIMLLVAGIANVFIQSSALMITLSVLAIGIFSAFILYDLKRVQDGLETNYISARSAST